MTGKRMGAPEGIAHGKARFGFDVVEWFRDLKEYEGLKDWQVFELCQCVPQETKRDWLYYRTRTRA